MRDEAEEAHVLPDPRLVGRAAPLDLDKEFDAGSGIALKALTTTQIVNLAMTGKVWGFLKYHHPAIVAGKRHWDYELFRVLPRVLAASDKAAGLAQAKKRLGIVTIDA